MQPKLPVPSILGGTLLVIGNVIGAGTLALPLALAQLGTCYAVLVLLFFWFLMMLGAYYLLEANLALPAGANLISMSRAALGQWGVGIAWVCNLVVMYSLISAYISGGGDLVKLNSSYLGIVLPTWAAPILFVLLFGVIVSRGIHITDHTNRILMVTKAVIFFGLIAGLATHFNLNTVSFVPPNTLSGPLLVVAITSFGFATLVPSLRSYYQSDIKKIKKIIFLGTFVPLVCYVLWVTVIFSVVPYYGAYGLEKIALSTHPVSGLQLALYRSLHITWLNQATNIFSAICIITSFLANSISLTDFIADGLNLYQGNQKAWPVYFIAYLPAICAVIFFQKAFLLGLSIAGTMAIVQLLILPACMVWRLRYSEQKAPSRYRAMGGKPLLAALLLISFVLLFFTIIK